MFWAKNHQIVDSSILKNPQFQFETQMFLNNDDIYVSMFGHTKNHGKSSQNIVRPP